MPPPRWNHRTGVAGRADERRVVITGVHVLSLRAGELGAELSEIDADGEIGRLEGVVEVAAVEEDAEANHARQL